MSYNFTEYDLDQLYLLPPSMRDWLREDHLVWFLIDAVHHMDLSAFFGAYRSDGTGQRAHHPIIMLSVLLYGYCEGVTSSRKLEKRCQEHVAYRILAGDTSPDHCAFSRFRKRHRSAMKSLFIEILHLCAAAGIVNVGKVSLDGTKMQSNASLKANRTEASLEKEIEAMLTSGETKDKAEDELYGKDRRGDELPEELHTHDGRLKRIQECKDRLQQERIAAEQAQQQKIDERQSGEQKKRGRKPKSVEAVREERSKRKANTTAPETRIMKTRNGYIQGFNAQAVCTDDQIILAATVTNQENDQGLFHPLMEKAQGNAIAVLDKEESTIKLGRGDAGYCNEADLSQQCTYEMLIATQKDWKQRKKNQESPPPRGRIPKGLSATELMERKLRTKRGRAEYKKRSSTIEPIFGQIKDGRDLDHFYSHDESGAEGEWDLICGTHNLMKLYRFSNNQN